MAKKDKHTAKEGFKIPIEDADGVTSDVAEATEATEAAEAADETGEAVKETAQEAVKETAQEGTTEVADETVAEQNESVEGGQADVQANEGDLVAEAEAIVEEASAANQLEAAQAQAQDWQDRYLRLHAEWDTYRRRMGEQRAEEKLRATEKLMENLLPVLDDFERTVSYAEENGETGLLDGVKAVQSKLLDALVKGGLEVIDPAGEPYEALEAQAVQMVPDEEAFEETVKDVYQKGYKMGKKVLRPAMVTVTTGGPKRPSENSD